jgi:hypothetical protein
MAVAQPSRINLEIGIAVHLLQWKITTVRGESDSTFVTR